MGGSLKNFISSILNLTLGQIHSALAYYWDHQKELDADIEKRLAAVEKTQQKTKPSEFLKRLKSEGLI